MQKFYAFALPCILLFLLSTKSFGQVIITNAASSVLIDFSATTPSSVGTNPQSAFTGAGFSPDPTVSGRLNSNAWAVTGWTDGSLVLGGTNITGDYARGAVSTAQTTGGMYAYAGAPGSAANPTLMIQPGGSDFAPGTLTLKIQNNGTSHVTQLNVSYNLYVRNDQGRSNSFNFSHSADNTTYTPVGALDYISPVASDGLGWIMVGSAPSKSTAITGLNIPPNGVYYLRWSSADVGGSGSRDEFGLDDINVSASFVSALPVLSINDVTLTEGNSGTTTFTFTVGLSAAAPAGGVTFDIATADNSATVANNDYVAKSLTSQTVGAGNTNYTFDVIVNSDFAIEPNESFFVDITNVTNATIGDGQGEGIITNDDALITYYPKLNASDLSQASQWTTHSGGGAGTSPADFTSPNQLFNLNQPINDVTGVWTISGGSNAVVNGALNFFSSARLNIGAGSDFNFNGRNVFLRSDASGTASIGAIEGTLSNASNVTVERYLSSNNNRAYRLLAPTVNTTSTIRFNWQNDGNNNPEWATHITGSTTGANGFDITQTGQPSLYVLDATQNYVPIANTDATNLDAKSGYLLYIRGDRTIDLNSTSTPLPSNNTTLRATGSLLTGSQTFIGLTGQQAGQPNTGFNLITNPYASPINWNSVQAASTNTAQAYTLWDPNIGTEGAYVTVGNLGIPSNALSNANLNIQSGQAFFVQASGLTAPVVNITEAHKSTVNNIDVFRLGAQTEIFSSTLFYTDGSGNRINADGVTSVFNNNYSEAVDANDAAQIDNWEEDIAISRNNIFLSIESRPLVDVTDTIPLSISRMQVRSYEWQFAASGFNHPSLSASLVDNFLNTKRPISLNSTTVIPFTVTSDIASSAANRFMVVFGPNTALPVNMSDVKAYQKGKDIQVEWTATTETNLDKYEVEESTDARQFTKSATIVAKGATAATAYDWLDVNINSGSNYYRIKAIGKTGAVQYSKVVRINMARIANEIIVYPNPVKGNVVSLGANLPKGSYTITITDKLGKEVYKKVMVHLGGAATQTLQLNANLTQGTYQLTVSDGENSYTQQLLKD